MGLLFAILLFFQVCGAPEFKTFYVEYPARIEPYEQIWLAVCQVESGGNRYAYHMEKDGWPAVGIAQIRWERLHHYNIETESHYVMKDMYDPAKSKKVFMHFAKQYGPYQKDLIIRRWNGSGKITYAYLNKVKKAMK